MATSIEQGRFFKALANKIQLLGNKSDTEENLKIHVTVWMLSELGYDVESFDYEHSLCRDSKNNKHADIYIPVQPQKAMFVETKKHSKDLTDDDVQQLAEYITLHNEIAWGILTNGRQIFLINNSIDIYSSNEKTILSKLVLKFEKDKQRNSWTNEKYIKYLTKESIYDSHVTYYYKAVAQFLAKSNVIESSKHQYQTTLFQFFDHCISRGKGYSLIQAREYAPLEDINKSDAIDFFKNYKSTTRQASGIFPKAKCEAICAMFATLKECCFIARDPMEDLRKVAKDVYSQCKSEEQDGDSVTQILTRQSIEIVLKHIDQKPLKKIVFILVSYYGFTLAKIESFLEGSWDNVNFEKHELVIEGKKYPIPKMLEDNLRILLKHYKDNGTKKPAAIYLFKKNGVFTKASGRNFVNGLFKYIQKINDEGIDWSQFSPQNIRVSIIFRLFNAGCSIEEIAYLSDSSASQIIAYLPDDIVDSNGAKKWKNPKTLSGGRNKHPFADIFD